MSTENPCPHCGAFTRNKIGNCYTCGKPYDADLPYIDPSPPPSPRPILMGMPVDAYLVRLSAFFDKVEEDLKSRRARIADLEEEIDHLSARIAALAERVSTLEANASKEKG